MPNLFASGALLTCIAFSVVAAADEASTFNAVRNVLEQRCLSCHNSVDQKGGFSLQTQAELAESGYVEGGDAAASHLLSVVLSDGDDSPQMPKDGEPLTGVEVAALRAWIDGGAGWPQGGKLTEPRVEDFDWWSLQPIERPNVPDGRRDWSRTPIDDFVFEKLRGQGLAPSPQADRRTLIRRLTFDLIGLPPTPEEVTVFINDPDPLAYERLVDRLLASPHYGERWGRHWLDVVKYADTCGYDKDKPRPNAWPYRDYVIRSFNEDRPYSRFVREQIAGDVLYPGEPDGVLGLGFIAAGPWDFIGHVEVPESKIDGKVARNLDRDEMVSNTLNTFCSTTVQCARCHNHKFDPITQTDYYRLQAVFAAVDRAERPYELDPNVEAQRRQLTAELQSAREKLTTMQHSIRKEGGIALAEIEKEIAGLEPDTAPTAKQPEFGYHSAIANSAETPKWVQLDLGRPVKISQIILHPCHDDFGGIGAGFGFPVECRVELSLHEDGFDDDAPTPAILGGVIGGDSDEAKTPIRVLLPRTIPVQRMAARYVRITATKLAERKDDFIFALAELTVLNDKREVVSAGASVSALDSIEAPVRWSKQNLVDGIWPTPADEEATLRYAAALRQRAELLRSINTPERQQKTTALQPQIDRLSASLTELSQGRMVYAAATHFDPQGQFKPTAGEPRAVSVLHRGNVTQPSEPVGPGTIPLEHDVDTEFVLDESSSEGDRRAALAEWLTRPEHPLVWRSIVNRIWQYHFGSGLVSTPNDFGRMGQLPTHPELLDWMASEFRESGGSIKHMHRLIVTSAAYRQSSDHRADAADIDGSNRFLWRMNRRRLSAEEIRDAILTVSGRLNTQMGGPGYYLFELERPEHSPHYEYHKHDPHDPASHRRAVYRFVVRSQPDPWMTTLDCANSSQSTPKREETLTSLQALSLLNNNFNLAMAEQFATRLTIESDDPRQQVSRATSLITGHRPTDIDHERLLTFTQEHGLENLCRLLLNLSEFVYVD